ncbi:hypothetical protein OSB04_008905, partial [Centaurea solstitialis]
MHPSSGNLFFGNFSDAIRWESFNTIVCYMWWVVGFFWLISDFKILLHSAPRLFWYVFLHQYNFYAHCWMLNWRSSTHLAIMRWYLRGRLPNAYPKTFVCFQFSFFLSFFLTLFFNDDRLVLAFLAVDVFFAFIAFILACLLGLAVCFCFPCIIAILCIIAGRGAASEEDISVLPRYTFKASSNEEQSEVGAGIMVPIETNGGEFSVERLLLAEDAVSESSMAEMIAYYFVQAEVHSIYIRQIFKRTPQYLKFIEDCCICLSPYEDGAELLSLFCNHHFHATCITKWLFMNATCPLCKHSIKPNEQ